DPRDTRQGATSIPTYRRAARTRLGDDPRDCARGGRTLRALARNTARRVRDAGTDLRLGRDVRTAMVGTVGRHCRVHAGLLHHVSAAADYAVRSDRLW